MREFSEKIRNLRSKAQETQAANKIIDMLTDLKLKNDETTSYRWVWELIQNAKDVVNNSGIVDIIINFDESNRIVEFKHNGKLFSTENIVFLIEQVSTKDRTITDEKDKKTTGKFGTGFLTTHLLSERVKVSGYLQDTGESPCSFEVILDRSGTDQQTIIRAIQESCSQLDKNTTSIINKKIDEQEFNTCFTYALDQLGLTTAKKGLKNLLIAAPYVFAFVPEIGSITVISGQYRQEISRNEIIETELENARVTKIGTKINNNIKNKYVFVLGTNDLSIAVEVDKDENNKFITKYHPQLPKIFCDFPLLGTDDFVFPVVINSSAFNPTEPRNGIHLTDKEHIQISENKRLLELSVQLYIKIIDYFLEKEYEGIYNITKIPKQSEKEWISKEWFEQEIITKLKSYILKIDLISTHSAGKLALVDEWDGIGILIPKDTDENVRKMVWKISSKLIPNKITKYEELEFWYDSLWEECRNYNLLDLIKRLEEFENINELSKQLDCNVITWLNELLKLFYSNGYTYTNELGRNPRILPNQHGDFCTLDEIQFDSGIDEVYKDISTILDFDFKSKLLDKRIESEFLQGIKNLTLDDIFSEFLRKMYKPHSASDEFYKKIISLQTKQVNEQDDFLKNVCELQGEKDWPRIKVSKHSQELLKLALKFWREKIARNISSYENINQFASVFNFVNEHEATVWLSNFVHTLVKYEQESLLDKIPMLPNQYGNFKLREELSLDSGEIDEIFKDAAQYAGYDIRETLLSKYIILQLPESRTIYLEDLSEKITQYVKENKNSIGQNSIDVKETFQKIYLRLRENSDNEKLKRCFKDLLTNLHWFYNDDDIAENMSKVEEYNDILEKYGVSGTKELEKILSRSNSDNEGSLNEKVYISMELLAQWGISNEEDLNRALADNVFGAEFIHDSKRSLEFFNYVQEILERSKRKIIKFLEGNPEYDVSELIEVSDTIFVIKKHNSEIYIIARPSDYGQVILYYDSEIDMLDYEKDCELWVEDDINPPQKITFGKILKLTGVNKIPLRSIKEND